MHIQKQKDSGITWAVWTQGTVIGLEDYWGKLKFIFYFWPKTLLSLHYLNLLRCSHTVVNKHSSDKIISSTKACGY